MRNPGLLLPAVIVAVLGASCGGTEEEPAAGNGAAAGSVIVDTAESDLGTILVDADGMTLYLFDEDEPGTSTCYDGCASTWPPLIGEATASGDTDASLLGTTERDDGSLQVTYDGMPLYHYAPDQGPGQVEGQGVGGIWWVVAPDGHAITAEASAESRDGGY